MGLKGYRSQKTWFEPFLMTTTSLRSLFHASATLLKEVTAEIRQRNIR